MRRRGRRAASLAADLTAAHPRATTRTERVALQQAVYDYVVAHTAAADPSNTKMQVSSVPVGSGRAAPYTAFAKVVLSDPSAGYAAVLLGSRSKGKIQGWHVIDLGSADVGCKLGTAVFGSHKLLLRSLGHEDAACPGTCSFPGTRPQPLRARRPPGPRHD